MEFQPFIRWAHPRTSGSDPSQFTITGKLEAVMPKFLQIFAVVFFMFTMSSGCALAQSANTTPAYGQTIGAKIVDCRNNELKWNKMSRYEARHLRPSMSIIGPDQKAYVLQAKDTLTTLCRSYINKSAVKPVETARQTLIAPAKPTYRELLVKAQKLGQRVKDQSESIRFLKSVRDVSVLMLLAGISSIAIAFFYGRAVRMLYENKRREMDLELLKAQTETRLASERIDLLTCDKALLTHQLNVALERLSERLPSNTERSAEFVVTRNIFLNLSEQRFKEHPDAACQPGWTQPDRRIYVEVHLDSASSELRSNFLIPHAKGTYRGPISTYSANHEVMGEKLRRDERALEVLMTKGLYMVKSRLPRTTPWFTKPAEPIQEDTTDAETFPSENILITQLGGRVSADA